MCEDGVMCVKCTSMYAQGGARAGGGGAKAAYGGVYTATTAATSYPTQAYTATPAQPAKRQYIHVNIGTVLFVLRDTEGLRFYCTPVT